MKTRIVAIISTLCITIGGAVAQNYVDDLYSDTPRDKSSQAKRSKPVKQTQQSTYVDAGYERNATTVRNNSLGIESATNQEALDNGELVVTIEDALNRRMAAYMSTEEYPAEFWQIQDMYIDLLRGKYDEDLYNVIALNDQVWVEPIEVTAFFDREDITEMAGNRVEKFKKENGLDRGLNPSLTSNSALNFDLTWYGPYRLNNWALYGYYRPWWNSCYTGGWGYPYWNRWDYPYYPYWGSSYYPGWYPHHHHYPWGGGGSISWRDPKSMRYGTGYASNRDRDYRNPSTTRPGTGARPGTVLRPSAGGSGSGGSGVVSTGRTQRESSGQKYNESSTYRRGTSGKMESISRPSQSTKVTKDITTTRPSSVDSYRTPSRSTDSGSSSGNLSGGSRGSSTSGGGAGAGGGSSAGSRRR